jgi:uncharacterized protein YjbI with pentapeptide repeats
LCWHDAKKLDRARLGDSILGISKVRELLVSMNGYKQDFTDANLRGANLNGVNLEKATLLRADLSGATLRDANLKDANLTEAQAVGTDFTRAFLTGACIASWNIDSTTVLENVDCQCVYEQYCPGAVNQYQERMPANSSKVFAPGDFEKLFKEVMDEVRILIRKGVHPTSFKETLQQLQQDYPGSAFKAIEDKGDDVLVKFQVPAEADKGKFEQRFDELYETRLEAAKATARLEAERQHNQDLKEIALVQARSLGSRLIVQTRAEARNYSPEDKSISVDGDVAGATLNQGEIQGRVENQANPDPPT